MPQLGDALLVALLVGVTVTLVSGVVRSLLPRTRAGFGPAALDGALVASVAGVVVATMTPFDLLFAWQAAPPEINLTPLDRLDGAPPRFAVINTLLLVPTVLLLAQRWRRAGIVRLTLTGAALSLTIELVQLLHPERGTNVDDLVLNTAGAAAAAIVGVGIRRVRGAHVPRRRAVLPEALEAEVASSRPERSGSR